MLKPFFTWKAVIEIAQQLILRLGLTVEVVAFAEEIYDFRDGKWHFENWPAVTDDVLAEFGIVHGQGSSENR